ncbi:GIY-YIG nuclease family protein [Nitrogeniibacter aestuarii]|uniref:GIY-YIG nuclease family protein n=1 Tax=Nitrogeniibacter aestuarii TaxID=2815343 RepID=UPI001D11091B|nr:GIY-YIG nuclease family protein [Nitrogeniibacter aestuarii]
MSKKTENPGVYGLLCVPVMKYYIGASENPSIRINSHMSQLRADQHPLRRLQRDWNKYGEAAFVVASFPCPAEQIWSHESFLIDAMKTLEHQRGYNKMKGKHWGDEARIRNTETKLVRSGKFVRLSGVPAETPMLPIYIDTMDLSGRS